MEPQLSDATVARCPFAECNARIIRVGESIVLEKAPDMLAKGTRFFAVNDVWDFDNIGVSKPLALGCEPVPGLVVERLLVCSDCDRGPLGFAGYVAGGDSVQDLRYYLSADSVKLT